MGGMSATFCEAKLVPVARAIVPLIALILTIASVAVPHWVSVDIRFKIATRQVTSNIKGTTGLWQICGSSTELRDAQRQDLCMTVPLEVPTGNSN